MLLLALPSKLIQTTRNVIFLRNTPFNAFIMRRKCLSENVISFQSSKPYCRVNYSDCSKIIGTWASVISPWDLKQFKPFNLRKLEDWRKSTKLHRMSELGPCLAFKEKTLPIKANNLKEIKYQKFTEVPFITPTLSFV